MQLIEPDERQAFLVSLQRKGLAEGEFELLETDTTDPKGDENVGLQGYVTVTRLSTQIAREYPIGLETGWVQHFGQDLEAGVFDKAE
ncbi:transcriptional regulator [Paraburkholderia panacisoli]|uniref:Transcriptional regulator n=1 Tax=Paraburkholderia panacisoli TaxID=2603818 RepID=A0A5B0GWS9_9BURK|nr:transcriptional regulator [Paraburkholderia panacisoli]KAA1007251.1 transcriptional regulator [Paraburkholderia panacisoli]